MECECRLWGTHWNNNSAVCDCISSFSKRMGRHIPGNLLPEVMEIGYSQKSAPLPGNKMEKLSHGRQKLGKSGMLGQQENGMMREMDKW